MDIKKRILGCIKKADIDYNLINNGDKIVIGVSGGKDSLLLLYCLNAYKKVVEKQKKFEIKGVHINLGFPNSNFNKVIDYYKEIGIEIEVIDSDVYDILKENKENNGRLPCSICSKMKKAIIINYAKENNFNKVSFAHHGDDAIETLVMNAIYGGRIATFSPKMHLDRSNITFIRPLIYAREGQILSLTKKLNLPITPSNCPNDKITKREDIKKMLNELYKKYPSSKDNFLLMLSNLEHLDLWEKDNL